MPLVWDVIFESYEESLNVLALDKTLRKSNNVFKANKSGSIQFTREYRETLMNNVEVKVSDRFISSAKLTAVIWYSAWIEAGQPELPN